MITLDKNHFPDAIRVADADNPNEPLQFIVYRVNVHPLKPAQLRLEEVVKQYGVKCYVLYRDQKVTFSDWAAGRITPPTYAITTTPQRKSKLRTAIRFMLSNPTHPEIADIRNTIDKAIAMLPEKDRVEFYEMLKENEKLAESEDKLERLQHLAEMAEKGRKLREEESECPNSAKGEHQ